MRFELGHQLFQDPKKLLEVLPQFLRQLERLFSANIGFGDGTDLENIQGKWIDYSSNGVANTDDSVTHDMGVIPVGFIVMVPPLQGAINRGSVAWTTTTVSLRCSAATQTAKIFLIAPPQES